MRRQKLYNYELCGEARQASEFMVILSQEERDGGWTVLVTEKEKEDLRARG